MESLAYLYVAIADETDSTENSTSTEDCAETGRNQTRPQPKPEVQRPQANSVLSSWVAL